MEQTIGLNDMVQCRLTKIGADILNREAADLVGRYPFMLQYVKGYKAGDIYKDQFWVLMQDLGGAHMGMELPFTDFEAVK